MYGHCWQVVREAEVVCVGCGGVGVIVFCFKQKTAYEMRISDWSSDVCSSDLDRAGRASGPRIRSRVSTGKTRADGVVGDNSAECRSEERRVGKSVSVRVDLGGRRIIKKKTLTDTTVLTYRQSNTPVQHYTSKYASNGPCETKQTPTPTA